MDLNEERMCEKISIEQKQRQQQQKAKIIEILPENNVDEVEKKELADKYKHFIILMVNCKPIKDMFFYVFFSLLGGNLGIVLKEMSISSVTNSRRQLMNTQPA